MATRLATTMMVLVALAPLAAGAVTRVSGVVTTAGVPRADVAVALDGKTARTNSEGRYTLQLDGAPDHAPKAVLDGWLLEARPRPSADGKPSFTEVDFVAVGATVKGRLPETLKQAPTVTDGVRTVVATRKSPDEEWAYTLELVPPGDVRLSATAPGATLRLHPRLKGEVKVDSRGKTGVDFIRVCALEGTLELVDRDGKPVPTPRPSAVVVLDVSAEFWVQEPATRQMSQKNQQFEPRLMVVKQGDTIEFVNEEENQRIEHAVDLAAPNPRRFPTSTKGVTGTQVFSNLGPTHVSCNKHVDMHADVYVAKGPFAALTGADGKWRIADVPDGAWTLTAWEPNGATVTLKKKVAACGKPVTVRLTQAPPPVRPCQAGDRYCGDDLPQMP